MGSRVRPRSTGSLGIAISEAVEDAATRDDTRYALGSVLNHVLLHQTVVGQEAREQLAEAGAEPDVIVGCVGGGSNFAGLVFPFIPDLAAGGQIRIVAAEPAACPTLTRGHYGYDFGDTAKTAPLLAMHTLGHGFVPAAIHSGGLRYHGMAPLISHMVQTGIMEARAYHQSECFAEAVRFARAEGIIPAPEPPRAARGGRGGRAAREEGVERTILFNLCGHGNFDMGAYDAFLNGEMTDYELPQEGSTTPRPSWRASRAPGLTPASTFGGAPGRGGGSPVSAPAALGTSPPRRPRPPASVGARATSLVSVSSAAPGARRGIGGWPTAASSLPRRAPTGASALRARPGPGTACLGAAAGGTGWSGGRRQRQFAIPATGYASSPRPPTWRRPTPTPTRTSSARTSRPGRGAGLGNRRAKGQRGCSGPGLSSTGGVARGRQTSPPTQPPGSWSDIGGQRGWP